MASARTGDAAGPLDPDLARRLAEAAAAGGYPDAGAWITAALAALSLEEDPDGLAHRILDGIGDGFFALDREWRIVMWNPAAEAIFGFRREEILGRSLLEASPTFAGTALEERYRAVMDGRGKAAFEAPSALRPDRVLDVRAFPLGEGIGVAFRDITERRRAEAAVRDSEERLRTLADNFPNGMIYQILREPDGAVSFTYLSQAVERLHGVRAEDVVADRRVLDDQILEEHRPRLAELRRTAEAGVAQIQIELPMRMPSGEVRWFLRCSAPRPLEGGRTLWDGVEIDITDRKRWEEHQKLLVNELNHRVKNTLATVQSIAAQSFRGGNALDGPRASFEARLFALSRAYDLLTRENWAGVSLAEVVAAVIEPYRSATVDPFTIAGPALRAPPRMALSLSMALHELCINAAKYGALSAGGRVSLTWTDGARLRMVWRESDGPPVAPPTRRGFGSRLIERGLAHDLGGTVVLDFAPEGVVCTIDVPVEGAGED